MGSPSKKVLITGIDGFTGRYLERALADRGHDVHGLAFPRAAGPRHTVCDITDRADLTRALASIVPDIVVHLAGISFPAHPDIDEIYAVNLHGTLNLFESLVKLGMRPEKVIVASSANVYGTPPENVIDETLCPSPKSHYSVSKLAVEHLSHTYADSLDVIITRPFNYTGVGQSDLFLIPKIVRHFREGRRSIELGNTAVTRDFSDVRYVADVYRRLVEAPAASETVNICSGRGISVLTLLEVMGGLAGYDIEVNINPAYLRKNELPCLIGSTDRLFTLIGRPEVIPIEETLRWMYGSA